MSATLTIDLPDDVKAILSRAAREEGVTVNAFALQALEEYLRLRRSRRRLGKATDEEINALRRTMDRMSRSAKRNGLTTEILDSILNGK